MSDKTPPSHWSPIAQPTFNRVQPFNFRYKGGVESFSFHVGSWIKAPTTRDVLGSGDVGRIKFWACNIIGRGFDLYRCRAVGARQVDTPHGPDIEVRLSFGPHWYEEVVSG